MKKRSHSFYDGEGNRVFVKKQTYNTWVKHTQWNSECRKSAYAHQDGDWRKCEDRVWITDFMEFEDQTPVIVIVHSDRLVMPTARNQSEIAVANQPKVQGQKARPFSQKKRARYEGDAAYLCCADQAMWSCLANSELSIHSMKSPKNRGCKTLLLELFCGALLLTMLASTAGWPVSQPTDIRLDGMDLLGKDDRKRIEEQIDRDDPFCLILPFPCGPWNNLT